MLSNCKNVFNKVILGSMFSTSLSGLSSCCSPVSSEFVEERAEFAKELLIDRPVRDYDKASAAWRDNNYIIRSADVQSTIDSIGYRKIFNLTNAARNSKIVEEFNSIASKMRAEKTGGADDIFNNLNSKMKKLDITNRDFEEHKKTCKEFAENSTGIGTATLSNYDKVAAEKQFKVDSLAYNQFFKKHNLLTPELSAKLKKISKHIKVK